MSIDKFRSARQVQQNAESSVEQIPVVNIVAYDDHPFEIKPDRVQELVESIRMNGILEPLLVRVHPEQRGKYECIAGHHRLEAARRLNLETVPAIIRAMTDTEADLAMVDTNIQRGFADLKPTEIGRIMQVRWNAMKHQGKKIEAETDSQTGLGMNERTARRYIRLIHLIPELANAVDDKRLPFLAGVELSFLPSAMQYTIATQTNVSTITKEIAVIYREQYESGKPFQILSSLPDTVTGSENQEFSDTVAGSENQEPSDTVTGSENQELSDTVTGNGNQDFIIKAIRHLGEESVFTDLVLRYLPEKEWSRKLKKSRWHIATEKMDVCCEAAGISIRKGKLVTVLSYHQAYDIIASLIRRGEWLSKEKMAELAVHLWTE